MHGTRFVLTNTQTPAETISKMSRNYPVHECAKKGDLKGLIKLVSRGGYLWNYDVDEREDETRFTPLHYACREGHLDIVRYLVESHQASVSISATNDLWTTPLRLAIEFQRVAVVKYLVQYHSCLEFPRGVTEFLQACRVGSLPLVKFFLDKRENSIYDEDSDGTTALHFACARGHVEVARFLIEECNMSLTLQMDLGRTPVHCAFGYCASDGLQIGYCASGGLRQAIRLPMVRYLMEEHSVDLMVQDKDMNTPLFFCTCPGILQYLHEERKVDAVVLATALPGAIQRGDLEMVRYLVETCHVNFNTPMNNGQLPRDMASSTNKRFILDFLEQCSRANLEDLKPAATETKPTLKAPPLATPAQAVALASNNEQGQIDVPPDLGDNTSVPTGEFLDRMQKVNRAFELIKPACVEDRVSALETMVCRVEELERLLERLDSLEINFFGRVAQGLMVGQRLQRLEQIKNQYSF